MMEGMGYNEAFEERGVHMHGLHWADLYSYVVLHIRIPIALD